MHCVISLAHAFPNWITVVDGVIAEICNWFAIVHCLRSQEERRVHYTYILLKTFIQVPCTKYLKQSKITLILVWSIWEKEISNPSRYILANQQLYDRNNWNWTQFKALPYFITNKNMYLIKVWTDLHIDAKIHLDHFLSNNKTLPNESFRLVATTPHTRETYNTRGAFRREIKNNIPNIL